MKGDTFDHKGLILEAYRIEGITAEECRSIFLDWALTIPVEADNSEFIRVLLDRHRAAAPEHPMTRVLEEGLSTLAAPRRRGGWRARARN